MPELPEVETVARDLRGLVVGARIVGVREEAASLEEVYLQLTQEAP